MANSEPITVPGHRDNHLAYARCNQIWPIYANWAIPSQQLHRWSEMRAYWCNPSPPAPILPVLVWIPVINQVFILSAVIAPSDGGQKVIPHSTGKWTICRR
ncbi:uncharacterized protein LOC134204815 [Armigeres subalbatus]|uniref:uncharacterized protein LOC134204815 n=1 Tax=Armigeres subalbatus TaxID=124917 RepID=UPI002ED3917D